MIEIKGKFNTAIVYCETIEEGAEEQIRKVCDREEYAGLRIRIMPDVHAGAGCTIGTTMTIQTKIVPGMVGVDIGCGMETIQIAERDIDFERLDSLVRDKIPCGPNVRRVHHPLNEEINLSNLKCIKYVNIERAMKSLGTLGGGNHFIEVDKDDEGNLYVVVHSGSRHIGLEVAEYYQDQGYRTLMGASNHQARDLIAQYKNEGRHREISGAIKALKKQQNAELPDIPKDLAYVEGELFDDYIHDMKLIQQFAVLNRKAMMDVIIRGMGFTAIEEFTTIHNYIDTDSMILRKGAVSAKAGEKLLIPINMRDGSLVCVGKGNEDWNYSAPHGAGRLMGRKRAIATLSLEEYKSEMDGIYSTCVKVTLWRLAVYCRLLFLSADLYKKTRNR